MDQWKVSFEIYKVEKYYLKKYETSEELKKDISNYIKFYNEERLQKNLGNRSPLEYRKFKEKMSIIELSTWQGTDQNQAIHRTTYRSGQLLAY